MNKRIKKKIRKHNAEVLFNALLRYVDGYANNFLVYGNQVIFLDRSSMTKTVTDYPEPILYSDNEKWMTLQTPELDINIHATAWSEVLATDEARKNMKTRPMKCPKY